ncbi:hypothetical protein AUJ69_02710 [Candidatus Woesearchaeota archaeon CG1_02_47_18]|nr:MAG: hypothetical protein AUJ69_02710 [Candidatus Woesearchaeota archaeon CG1_02_47_18]HII29856.1 NUDIX hydrolase [Candidatus Woesearchaeota archaeon]
MIYRNAPPDFNPRFEVVSCLCEYDGRVLLLHRQDHASEGNKWGVPAGKVYPDEEHARAAVRELWEETGFKLPQQQLAYFGRICVRCPDYDFLYHMFHARLNKQIDIRINRSEHKGFIWVSPKEALKMDLVLDEDKCIRLFYKIEGFEYRAEP